MKKKDERREKLKQELLNQCSDIETLAQLVAGIAYRNKQDRTDEFSAIANLAGGIRNKAANMFGLICRGDDE